MRDGPQRPMIRASVLSVHLPHANALEGDKGANSPYQYSYPCPYSHRYSHSLPKHAIEQAAAEQSREGQCTAMAKQQYPFR